MTISDDVSHSHLRSIFEQHRVTGLKRVAVTAGDMLLQHDEEPKFLYLVRRGLFAVCSPKSDGGGLIGLVGPDEPIGEIAWLAKTRHRFDVVALRDSVVEKISSAALESACLASPSLLSEIAAIGIRRARAGVRIKPPSKVIALLSISPGADSFNLAHRLADAASRQGLIAIVADGGHAADDNWLDQAEAKADLIFIHASTAQTEWAAICRRQADRVLLHGRFEDQLPTECAVCESEIIQQFQRVDLVLERDSGRPIEGSLLWKNRSHSNRLFHVDTDGRGIDRLLRIIAGKSVGLALSGGGARAFAHVGVVRALREAQIPIDLVCGTSMGAIVAAGVALGWDDVEMDLRIRQAFVDSSPLDDIALPLLAMTRGHKVDQRLAEHMGNIDILDLEVPYFCVSSDLTLGAYNRHDSGPLARAVRASISLPGILPPVIDNGSVLVDGGVLRNMPTDLMRDSHEGIVIGSDVSRDAAIGVQDINLPNSWLRWFGSGSWRKGPPIVSILMRSATLPAAAEIRAARESADIYIMPEVKPIEIRNWQAYPTAVAAGYEAATTTIAEWTFPKSANG